MEALTVRVLGVDPGLRITGYGCVGATGGGHELVEAGVIRLRRAAEDEAGVGGDARSVSSRLKELDRDFRALLERLRPDAVAVEGLFAHAAHPATAIVMGHARGVLLLAIAQCGVQLVEIKPAAVKKFLTGSGRADKGQMQRAVRDYFRLPELPSPPDVADALAIAACAAERLRLGGHGELGVSPRRSRKRTLAREVMER